jgi:hypothetical protein
MEVSVKALYNSGLEYISVSDDKAPLILNHLMLHEMREDFILNSLDPSVENILGMKEFQNLIKSILDQQIFLNLDLVKEAGKLELLRVDFLDSISSDVDKLLQNNYDNVVDYTKQFYDIGKEKGFGQLQVKQFTSQADTHALFNLTQNNFGLIKNISDDVSRKIRKEVWEGVSRDESVVQIAKRLENVGLEPIETIKGRKYTVEQRASMIARTESARCRNQGLVMSYLQYGVEYFNSVVVKTPGTCNDCLDIEDKGPYSIKKESDKIPPHHTRCNCHPEPAEEPNKEPKDPESFPDLLSGENVKTNPNITLGNNEFIKYSKDITDFQKATANYSNEAVTVFDSKGTQLLDKYTMNLENRVRIPENIMNIGRQNGFELNMHNHPSKVPIPSKGDIINFISTKTKYGVVTSSEKLSLTTIKNNALANNMKNEISSSYKRAYDNIKNDFVRDNSLIGLRIQNQYPNDIVRQKGEWAKEFKKYAQNNPEKIAKELNNKLNTYGINIQLM